jgi:cytochrome c-type biogenesis protein CcmH/NrfG
MTIAGRFKSQRGATRLGVMDIVAALILLGVLLFASYLEFPNYQRLAAPSPAASPAAPSAPK